MAVTGDTSVLVLRALGLGDLLTGVPALRGLRRAYPSARIVLATPAVLEPLALWCTGVDEVAPTARLGELCWAGPVPDVAVNLHGRGPESIADLMSTGAKTIISHSNCDTPDVIGPLWRDDVHDVDRWCALLESAGISCRGEELGIDRPPGYPRRDGVVVIHPGAASAARRWPPDRFAAVAAALTRAGYRVVVTGSAAERSLTEIVAAYAGLRSTSVLAGELDLLGMVALISDARLLVCGDTGVGHIATATGTPSVLLFGPTPPAQWGPRGTGRHIALWTGDRGDPHADRPDPGLMLITVARVIAAARELLAECA
ncbi:glycosyltransferase family 9 protein [Mycolicibacter virginiensis]|uniref:glycosyltransferase family 9 protein n=1 Tax=Mycolicibacter virginiensis TaxID=1795032 RepID=UPI00197B79E3|nr:glycosyltransferase family 9 protein [Mycolicibacter virginiensis]